ncbi:hypothetical protein SCLCIDRAFT_52568, partial [Scleroderma citrinum Foug A]
EAISNAAYLKNRSPPQPNLLKMHCFGCPIYICVENAGKLDKKAKQAKFIGYNYNSKGYRV